RAAGCLAARPHLPGSAGGVGRRPASGARDRGLARVRRTAAGARDAALAVALVHAAASPFAAALGPGGQTAYLALLLLPAVLLGWPEIVAAVRGASISAATVATAAVIALWIVARLASDVGSPRVADVVDGWRGFLDVATFVG